MHAMLCNSELGLKSDILLPPWYTYHVTALILPEKTPATAFLEHTGPGNLTFGKIAAFSLGIN